MSGSCMCAMCAMLFTYMYVHNRMYFLPIALESDFFSAELVT